MKQLIVLTLKIAVSAAVLIYLARADAFDGFAERFVSADWRLVTLAALILFSQIFVAALRWRLIARAFDVRLPFRDFFRLSYIGVFFTLIPMGMIGADIVRSWYLSKSRAKLSSAVHSVIADRVVSVAALCIIVIACLPSFVSVSAESPAQWAFVGILIVCGSGYAALLLLQRLLPAQSSFAPLRQIRELSAALGAVTLRPRHAAPVYAAGIVSQLFSVAAMAMLFPAFGLDVPVGTLFALLPFVLFAAMIPLTVAGWGFREAAMLQVSGLLGVPVADAVSVSVVYGLLTLAVGAGGCVPWLLYRSEPVLAGRWTTHG